jgi:hypothetical protein
MSLDQQSHVVWMGELGGQTPDELPDGRSAAATAMITDSVTRNTSWSIVTGPRMAEIRM